MSDFQKKKESREKKKMILKEYHEKLVLLQEKWEVDKAIRQANGLKLKLTRKEQQLAKKAERKALQEARELENKRIAVERKGEIDAYFAQMSGLSKEEKVRFALDHLDGKNEASEISKLIKYNGISVRTTYPEFTSIIQIWKKHSKLPSTEEQDAAVLNEYLNEESYTNNLR